MLDNLLDIEVAYSLLRGGAQDDESDPIDINYEKLKTVIEVRNLSGACCSFIIIDNVHACLYPVVPLNKCSP